MRPEELAEQVDMVVISRGASGLSDWQKETLRKAAKKLRRLDSDTEKELAKVKEKLAEVEKDIEDWRSEITM